MAKKKAKKKATSRNRTQKKTTKKKLAAKPKQAATEIPMAEFASNLLGAHNGIKAGVAKLETALYSIAGTIEKLAGGAIGNGISDVEKKESAQTELPLEDTRRSNQNLANDFAHDGIGSPADAANGHDGLSGDTQEDGQANGAATSNSDEQNTSPKANRDDVSQMLQEINNKKGLNAARELLAKFGASRISELTEEKFGAFVQAGRELV